MPLISVPEVVKLAEAEERQRSRTASAILKESIQEQRSRERDTYDIFLSHRYADRKVIRGTQLFLQQYGHSVYIDWLVDTELDRTKVTKRNADILRQQMDHCRCLLYVPTDNSDKSVWMPWELGYMDGKSGRAAILPLTPKKTNATTYAGQEYLGLYPFVYENTILDTGTWCLWVKESPHVYVDFNAWLGGQEPWDHGDG
jgi:hypothetical protein